jgi:hypothetical protein
MKKIFTLLFCVASVAFAASAEGGKVQQCIDVILGKTTPTKLMATNLDANNDGVIDVGDVTMLIKQDLEKKAVKVKAPAQRIDVERLIKESLESPNHEPNISDVNQAIDHNLKLQ